MKNTKSRLLFLFAAFFLFLAFAEGFLLYIANASYAGLVAENVYQKGLKYSTEILGKKKAQKALNWKPTLSFLQDPEKKANLTIMFILRDGDKKEVECEQIKSFIKRPVTHKFDQELFFQRDAEVGYIANITVPLAGQWEIELVAKCRSGIDFHTLKRIVVTF